MVGVLAAVVGGRVAVTRVVKQAEFTPVASVGGSTVQRHASVTGVELR